MLRSMLLSVLLCCLSVPAMAQVTMEDAGSTAYVTRDVIDLHWEANGIPFQLADLQIGTVLAVGTDPMTGLPIPIIGWSQVAQQWVGGDLEGRPRIVTGQAGVNEPEPQGGLYFRLTPHLGLDGVYYFRLANSVTGATLVQCTAVAE